MSFVRFSVVRGNSLMNYFSLTLSVLIILVIHGSYGQDIVFPGERRPINQRLGTTVPPTLSPTPLPRVCPANMSLSREPDEMEGFCECIVGNLYHPKLDRCFLQYTRGPCREGEHFILQKNWTVARCVRNPCTRPSMVSYKGRCYDLYVSGGPCKLNETLTIPETSFEPECVEIKPVNYQFITAPKKACAPGTRRASFGKCREIIP